MRAVQRAQPSPERLDPADRRLAEGVLDRDPRALAKTITLVESSRRDHQARAGAILERLLPHTGGSFRIGISGAPGAGKSTFIETLGRYLTARGHRLAVLAVDPTSALSGGSILGDKTRMESLARSPDAFIRPSPSGGTLGGVAHKTREAMLVCEAAGYDVLIIETVGVGQSETAVAGMTDCFVLVALATTSRRSSAASSSSSTSSRSTRRTSIARPPSSPGRRSRTRCRCSRRARPAGRRRSWR